MRRTKYTAEVLGPIVAKARSYSEVLRRLGLQATGGNHRLIAARIRQAGLDTSHFVYGKALERALPIASEILAPLILECGSFRQVLMRLGLPTVGRPHRELKRRVHDLGLDTSHFHGGAWAKGLSKATHSALASAARKRALRDHEVFIENGPLLSGPKLTPRLLALGWSYQCAWCSISSWRGIPLVLHLDHVNGINNDNRLVNLRFLCPNCHSQTDTYCNRARDEWACYTLSNASVVEWQTRSA